MEIYVHKTEIELTGVTDFDLGKTFECGQCFRWNKGEEGNGFAGNSEQTESRSSYLGIAFGRAARLRHCGESIFITGTIEDFESVWRSYFDLDRNYAEIRQSLCIDDFMKQAAVFGEGIRILRQDKWEALCSFIISQNNNIPRIKSIIDTLCREFGDVVHFEDQQLFAFPSAERLAALDALSLVGLRCGYRAEYIINAARKVADGILDLDTLANSTPETARFELKKVHGVGDKVADCVMLFGLHMLDSFPLDVWMKRAVVKHYGPDFDPNIFSPYAGIAQQYIFHFMRNER